MAKNKRILIVDDQQDLREQMAKLLSRSSKNTETASLVKQMRSRIMGSQTPAEEEEDSGEEAERGSYEVDTASQGQEALQKVKKALEEKLPYSTIFLDMRMPPGWDGMETAKRIREMDKLIEIVIMTAYADHDQDTVAKAIGVPEKLLYIKKPFQAEEIFQLALCLSSKWSAEEDERLRRAWLESLLRSISRIKGAKTDKGESIFACVLKALLLFTGAPKGFIAALSGGKWILEQALGMEASEATAYIQAHKGKLEASSTAQQLDGKYLLPLKRDGSISIAVLYEMSAPGDPEWYKLLNLLVMTASEALHLAVAQEELHRNEREKALEGASAKIAAACLPKAKALADASGSQEAKELLAAISKLAAFGAAPAAEEPRRFQLVEMLQQLCSELKLEAPGGVEISAEISGIASAEALCPPKSFREAVKALAVSRALAAAKAGAKALLLKICVKPDASAFHIDIEDDGPGIPEKAGAELFEPFALDEGLEGFGLALPMARRQLKAAGIALKADSSRPKGPLFSASVPSAPKA